MVFLASYTVGDVMLFGILVIVSLLLLMAIWGRWHP